MDPPAGVGEACDACGIVVCGRRGDALYVIADETVQGLGPEGWANRVAAAARWHASKGKVARAEPVALRFKARRAFLAGRFPQLED